MTSSGFSWFAPSVSGTAAKRVNAVEHVSVGRPRQQRRTPTTPRCAPHDITGRKGTDWASSDLCRKLFGEVGVEAEQGPHGQKKQTSRCQSASLDDVPVLTEKGKECVDTVSTEQSRGGQKFQEKRVDSRTRLFRTVSEERNTAKLQTAIKELRAQINVSMCDAMEAAQARLAAQFLNAIVPSYDDLRQRVGVIESQMLRVTDSLSGRAHEGRETQFAEHLVSVWPERLGERLVALEERSDSISALEQAVADLHLPLVALESRHEAERQLMAHSEPICEALRNRITALELQYATMICGCPASDVQKAINLSEQRLMNGLQAVRGENRERVQVLSSQLLEVRVAALQAQASHDNPSKWWSKSADSTLQLTGPVS